MLPFYTLDIDLNDETGVSFNALVDVPAHLKSFDAFANKKPIAFDLNEEKRIVTGVMISAGTPIYRPADEQAPEHYVIFKAEAIERIRKKFHKQQLGAALNEMHDLNKKIDGVYMIQSYIIGGPKNPACPEVFANLNLQPGTWIASYQVDNEQVWNDIKQGKFNGFSVEGIFIREEAKVKTSQGMKAAAGRFGSVSEVSKWTINIDQDSYEVGEKLTITEQWGEEMPVTTPLRAGEYTLEDGSRILVDSDGIIRNKFKQIQKMKKSSLFAWVFGAVAATFAELTTAEGVVLMYEGELAEGLPVFVEVDGEQVPAPEGPHQVEIDGVNKIITLDANGVIVTIEDVEGEPTGEEMITQKDFKAFMTEYHNKLETQLKEADDVIKRQSDVITAQGKELEDLKAFASSRFSYSPKKVGKGSELTYRDLL